MKLEILEGRRGLETAEDSWRKLTDSRTVTSISQLADYYLAYARAFEVPDEELLIAVVSGRADRTMAVVPLRRRTRSALGIEVTVLAFPDVPVPIRDIVTDTSLPQADIVDFLVRALGKQYRGRWDYIHFHNVPGESPLVSLRNEGKRCSLLAQAIGVCHRIDVSKPDYIGSVLNSNARNNLRRSRKKIDKLGKVEFRTVSAFPELETAYDQFLETEAAGWKSVRGGKRAIKLHADQTRFYYDLMKRLATLGQCHIHILLVNDQPVACDFCVVSGERCFSLKHGYDETFSRFAPGNLLRAYTIEYYQSSGSLKDLDLVSGWDWQRRWRPERNDIFDIKIFRHSLRGTMLYYVGRLRQLIKNKKSQG